MILFRLLPALPAVVLLAGCLPIETYHKTGAPVARVQSDDVECKVDALTPGAGEYCDPDHSRAICAPVGKSVTRADCTGPSGL